MRWGRTKQTDMPPAHRGGGGGRRAVLIAGIVLCTAFFTASLHAPPDARSPFSRATAQQAIEAFRRDHVFLSDTLGMDEFFPENAVSAGAFEEKSEAGYRDFVTTPRWTFQAYLREALRRFFTGERP